MKKILENYLTVFFASSLLLSVLFATAHVSPQANAPAREELQAATVLPGKNKNCKPSLFLTVNLQ